MHNNSKKITTLGLLVAIGLLLPIVFHSFAIGGKVFLPMHIPVLLGGFLLPPSWALLIGIIIPFLSSVLTGMPPLFPTAIQMMFELATYGLVVSYIYNRYRTSIYPALLGGMLAGRIIAGIVNFILLTQFMANTFSLSVYLTAVFVTSLPGIVIQLVIIPVLVKVLDNAQIIQKGKGKQHEH